MPCKDTAKIYDIFETQNLQQERTIQKSFNCKIEERSYGIFAQKNLLVLTKGKTFKVKLKTLKHTSFKKYFSFLTSILQAAH